MPLRKTIFLTVLVFASLTVYAENDIDSIPADTVLLDDGVLYIGQIRDSLFNGHGRCIYTDGTVYEGNWKDGLWDGQGIVVYPDGDIYKGEFHNHIKEGKGTYIYGSGARYDGEWKNDRFNGEGKLLFEDGGRYEGSWKDDMKHGYGRLISPEGRATTGYYYFDEYLGMPYDTEINCDSTMTDELRSWGFKQEDPEERTEVLSGLSYGSKGMFTLSLLHNSSEHFYYGASIGVVLEPPTRGPLAGGIGFLTYENDIHFKGEFISSQYLIDIGFMFLNRKISIGGSGGVGIRSAYMNCQANGSTDHYYYYQLKTGDSYSRKGAEGLSPVFRGYLGYSIIGKKRPKAHVYLGYGSADGLFMGASWYLY